jgi:hypothetical protein
MGIRGWVGVTRHRMPSGESRLAASEGVWRPNVKWMPRELWKVSQHQNPKFLKTGNPTNCDE